MTRAIHRPPVPRAIYVTGAAATPAGAPRPTGRAAAALAELDWDVRPGRRGRVGRGVGLEGGAMWRNSAGNGELSLACDFEGTEC